MLGEIEGRRRKGEQKIRWLDGITDSMDMNLGKLLEMVRDREAWHATIHGVSTSQAWLGDWTTATINKIRSNQYCPLRKSGSVLKRNFNDLYFIYNCLSFLGVGILKRSSFCVDCDVACPWWVMLLGKKRRHFFFLEGEGSFDIEGHFWLNINCVFSPWQHTFLWGEFGSIHANSVKI